MADDGVEKLREFIILNAKEKLSHERLRSLESAIENAGKQPNIGSLRRQASAAHADWFTAYKKLYETTTELLQRDCIPIEGPDDLEALADLRELFFYGGKCGIRANGQALEDLLRRKAERLILRVCSENLFLTHT